jgi:hypothetical protein
VAEGQCSAYPRADGGQQGADRHDRDQQGRFRSQHRAQDRLPDSYDFKAATHAAKLGQTFSEANRATKAGGALRDLAQAVRSIGFVTETAPAAKDEKKSLLGKFDLKSILPKKDKSGNGAKDRTKGKAPA